MRSRIDTERDTLLHISTTDDAKHKDRDGFSIEIGLVAVNADGNEVDMRKDGQESLTSLASGTLLTDLIPDNFAADEVQREVIYTALLNPTAPVSDIHCKVNEKIDGQKVSYEKVHTLFSSTIQYCFL